MLAPFFVGIETISILLVIDFDPSEKVGNEEVVWINVGFVLRAHKFSKGGILAIGFDEFDINYVGKTQECHY